MSAHTTQLISMNTYTHTLPASYSFEPDLTNKTTATHFTTIGDPPIPADIFHTPQQCITQPCFPVLIGGCILPIPPKLYKKITDGQ